MYYNRLISDGFARNIMEGGQLHWLLDYVKTNPDLDILIGKNNKTEWISVYRGLTRIIRISPTNKPDKVKADAAKRYKELFPEVYGIKLTSDISKISIENIRKYIESNQAFDRYYNNKKEGYYQNIVSREFGICGNMDSEFIIVDKEAVIGYENKAERFSLFEPIKNEFKELQHKISEYNPKRYGSKLYSKSIGNELDFVAVDKDGNILLIEFKHGSNTSGIYLSPLQIGLYFELFNNLPKDELKNSVIEMVRQKQEIGLISPDWRMPELSGEVIPVLIISHPNSRSTSYEKYGEILKFCRKERGQEFLKEIRTYSYTENDKLTPW